MPTAPNPVRTFDIRAAARDAARQFGFLPDVPADAMRELGAHRVDPGAEAGTGRDLRTLLWSSIDDDRSRDLDQIEVAAKLSGDAVRVSVAIADVDAFVPRGSALDAYASHNATTLYTGVETFPMLPLELSTDRSSLAPNQDRLAIVVAFSVAGDGSITDGEICRGVVRNHAQLAYDGVGAWLAGAKLPPPALAAVAGLPDQVRLQQTVAQRLRARRAQSGALQLETIQSIPVVSDGRVVEFQATLPGPARDLIEDFMIAANTTIAGFLTQQSRSSIRRVVRTPQRWPRIVELAKTLGATLPADPNGPALAAFLAARRAADPVRFPDLSLAVIKLLGPGEYVVEPAGGAPTLHFGLAVDDYTHGTAPNRRYADLATQRIIKATLAGASAPYSDGELAAIATHCTEQEDNARRAARLVAKQAAAVFLAPRIGQEFDAIVTGVTDHGTYARLLVSPQVEGHVAPGPRHLDVGDRVKVRLTSTDPARGFIDLAAVG